MQTTKTEKRKTIFSKQRNPISRFRANHLNHAPRCNLLLYKFYPLNTQLHGQLNTKLIVQRFCCFIDYKDSILRLYYSQELIGLNLNFLRVATFTFMHVKEHNFISHSCIYYPDRSTVLKGLKSNACGKNVRSFIIVCSMFG